MIDGINLSKKEFKLVSSVANTMDKTIGEVYENEDGLIEEFEKQMREHFDAYISFEKVRIKNNDKCNVGLYACRFKKDRPLIFLIYDYEHRTWNIVDEKRFNVYSDPNGPFESVKI